MAKLTVKFLESLRPENHGDTIREEGSLLGKVFNRRNGISVAFYYRFKWGGKTQDFSCGTWPKLSLSKIRSERDSARLILAKGISPIEAKKALKIEQQSKIKATIEEASKLSAENLTVSDLFKVWLKDGVSRRDGNAELNRRFQKDIIPNIGLVPIKELNDSQIRDLLRKVSKRGVSRLLISLHSDLNQMFKWAEKRKPWRPLLIDGNPVELVEVSKLISPDYREERDRILSDAEISELSAIFKKLESDYDEMPAGRKYEVAQPIERKTQIALWICLCTLCRIGELLTAEWKNIDFENKSWFIPKTKNNRAHTIFLSDHALGQFKALHAISGETNYLYPSRNNPDVHVSEKSVSKIVGDRQIQFKNRKPLKNRRNDNSLVLADGKSGDWTPHDLRRTGATIMQALGVSLDIIDRCQNHVLSGSKVRRHYLHYDYEKEKRNAWGMLGHKIAELISE